MVVHVLSFVFTGFMFYLANPGSDLFSWHPSSMTMGFVLLLLQAIAVFSPESSLFPASTRQEKITLHWMLHAFGLASAIFGFGAVYLNKEVNNRKHFTTWHATFGIVTLGFAVMAAFGGMIAKFSQSFKNYIRPINVKTMHATAGLVVFLLAMTTIGLATYSNWFRNRVSKWLARACVWVPVVLAVCVARQVTQSYVPKVFTPRESVSDAKARTIQERIEAKKLKNKNQKAESAESAESDDAKQK